VEHQKIHQFNPALGSSWRHKDWSKVAAGLVPLLQRIQDHFLGAVVAAVRVTDQRENPRGTDFSTLWQRGRRSRRGGFPCQKKTEVNSRNPLG